MSATVYQPIDPDVRRSVLETAQRFAQRGLAAHIDGESSEINPSAYAAVLTEAREIGLATGGEANTDPVPGIWGPGLAAFGPSISLEILQRLAQASPDAALWLHFEGLATHIHPNLEGPTLLALGESGVWPKPLLHAAAPSEVRCEPDGKTEEGVAVTGTKRMVLTPPSPNGVLVAAGANRWTFSQTDHPKTKILPLGPTLGFRGSKWSDVEFVGAPQRTLETQGDKLRHYHSVIALHWLGLGAIALGIANSALAKASVYAAERFQGGKIIRELPAIQELLGVAIEKTAVLEALLANADALPLGTPPALVRAAIVKKGGIEAACEATTRALQVFGGYGYMEDYGVESLLRDAETLRVMHGTPDRLQCLIFNFSKAQG